MNIEERVARLEKLLTSKVLGGADQTLRTSRLELVNAEKKVEAVLSPAPGGGVAISDQMGGNKTVIGVGDRGPELILTTRDGGNGIRMNITPQGKVLFGLYDGNHKARATMSVVPSGPSIDLRDERGKIRLGLTLQENGDPYVELVDSAGHTVVSVGTLPEKGTAGYLRLADSQGTPHLLIGVTDQGQPSIVLTGPDGKTRAILMTTPDNNNLSWYDADGNLRFAMGIGPKNTPELCFFSDLGKKRLSLANGTELTGLVINDSNEAGRLLLSVDTDERPWLSVIDPSGASRVKVTVLPDGSPGIALNDAAGQHVLLLTSRAESPGLLLCDPTGKTRAILTLGPEGSSLVLTDESGEPTFHAP